MPSRASTSEKIGAQTQMEHFNPRCPHEHRLCFSQEEYCAGNISIHDALTSIDIFAKDYNKWTGIFQSTTPSRASTGYTFIDNLTGAISIHDALTSIDRKNTQPPGENALFIYSSCPTLSKFRLPKTI